jgi:hypothetical protein
MGYDECWELIEDLADLDEDGEDWNFNFWLYPFMSGQSATLGVESVTELLLHKLNGLQNACQRLPINSMPLYKRLLARTLSTAKTVVHHRGRVFAAIARGSVMPFANRLACQRPTYLRAIGVAASDPVQSDVR